MLNLASVCILAGDPGVRVAAAAADLRALHAPRLPHPHPHQVGVRVSLHMTEAHTFISNLP